MQPYDITKSNTDSLFDTVIVFKAISVDLTQVKIKIHLIKHIRYKLR